MNDSLIYGKLADIMQEIEPIAKDRKNQAQGYNFRGIDDVMDSLGPIMAKHRVFLTTETIDIKREERQTAKGGTLIYTILTEKISFWAEDGSSVWTIKIGEGMDSGDKSSNKASSVAVKNACIQMFMIPTKEPKDPENDSHEVKPTIKSKPSTNINESEVDSNKVMLSELKKNIVLSPSGTSEAEAKTIQLTTMEYDRYLVKIVDGFIQNMVTKGKIKQSDLESTLLELKSESVLSCNFYDSLIILNALKQIL